MYFTLFCKICEEQNRYSGSEPREKESDILELVDQFGGMLLDRPERIGFKPDEALVLLEHRNLKDEYNRLISEQYPLEYMNFDANIQNVENRKKEIIDTRTKQCFFRVKYIVASL